jgi:putative tryptophan/tyrosine transport system substrate-binding protein
MRRREFLGVLSGAAATWPLAARAQQSAMPVIGFAWTGQTSDATGQTSDAAASYVAAFRQGLRQVGLVEGQNVAVEYRWTGGQPELVRAAVAEFVQRQLAVIVGNTPLALAAKSATSTIPIVFVTGTDPVRLGLVVSDNRPGGNVTGVNFLSIALEGKRLGLLRDLLPRATVIASLVDPNSPDSTTQLSNVQDASHALGWRIQIVQASTESQLDSGFATLARERPNALIVVPTPFFSAQRKRIVEFAARHSLPAIYGVREFPAGGGLISYGTSIADAYRQAGIYAGRILKGEKPADLPVLQPTKFELVINLTTAKTLGLNIPPGVLAIADEVIE